jgi:hypothetical protein
MFWKKESFKEILKNAPGPSPWYIRAFPPHIEGFRWGDSPDDENCSGITTLRNSNGKLLALFDFDNYILPLKSGEILIWHQPYESNAPTKDIACMIINPNNLLPIGNELLPLCKKLRKSKISSMMNGSEIVHFKIPTNVPPEQKIDFEFPVQLHELPEFLILCHSSGICEANSYEEENIGLLVAVPEKSSFTIFPQVWFNKGGLDYGYQWITRVARGKDGKIYGEGIRISPFRLDNTLKNIEKTYN